eukprot:SAG31_NODE_3712_length_3957_cov_9.372041_5_plen_57_part_00
MQRGQPAQAWRMVAGAADAAEHGEWVPAGTRVRLHTSIRTRTKIFSYLAYFLNLGT